MLKSIDVKLNIIGCGFLDLEDDATDEEIEAAFALDATRTAEQKGNERVLRSFCALAGGAVLPAVDALSLLTQVRARTVGQVSLFRGPLRIGDTEIEVFAFGKTKQVNMPTLSKLSTVAPEAAGSDATHAVQMSRSYWNKLEDSAAAQEVQDDQKVCPFLLPRKIPVSAPRLLSPFSFLHLTTPLATQYSRTPSCSQIKAYAYGKELLPVAPHDLEHMKYKADKCLVALGFLDIASVPRHFFTGSVDVIVPAPGNAAAALALSAFARACATGDAKRGILVRFVKRQNSAPRLGILTPVVEPNLEGFYFNQLPFAEDVRSFTFASFDQPKFAVSEQQRDATRRLVASLDLSAGRGAAAGAGEDDDGDEILQPERTFNPSIQRFYATVQARALDPQTDLPPLDEAIRAYVEPDARLLQRAAADLRSYAAAFHLPTSVSAAAGASAAAGGAKPKKRFWRDLMQESISAAASSSAAGPVAADGADSSSSKRSALGLAAAAAAKSAAGDSAAPLAASLHAAVESVSAADPLGSFRAVCERRPGGRATEADVAAMWAIVSDAVAKSFKEHAFGRAAQCIHALREACVVRGAPSLAAPFNRGLEALKMDGARPDFVAVMSAKGVRPIDQSEDAASEYTAARADQFLAASPASNVAAAAAPAAAEQADDDDPFASLE